MLTIKISRKVLVLAAAVVAVAAVGVAVAAWQTTGTGDVYAKATTGSVLTLSDASASTTADLYPGATGTAKIRVTNSNPFPVRISTVTKQVAASIASDKGASCNASTGVAFVDQTGLAFDLAAGATNTFTLSGAVSMTNASDNSCQGAIFTIPVTVTAASNA